MPTIATQMTHTAMHALVPYCIINRLIALPKASAESPARNRSKVCRPAKVVLSPAVSTEIVARRSSHHWSASGISLVKKLFRPILLPPINRIATRCRSKPQKIRIGAPPTTRLGIVP